MSELAFTTDEELALKTRRGSLEPAPPFRLNMTVWALRRPLKYDWLDGKPPVHERCKFQEYDLAPNTLKQSTARTISVMTT